MTHPYELPAPSLVEDTLSQGFYKIRWDGRVTLWHRKAPEDEVTRLEGDDSDLMFEWKVYFYHVDPDDDSRWEFSLEGLPSLSPLNAEDEQ